VILKVTDPENMTIKYVLYAFDPGQFLCYSLFICESINYFSNASTAPALLTF